jgi:ribose transport system ATP-binding protein
LPLLTANNLSKSYSGTLVLREVPFELRPGEVHALLGENGAGKSTLCRIIAGITPPNSGEMQLNGAPYSPRSRRDAESSGVRIVLQEMNLLPTLTVAENIYFDKLPSRLGFIDYRKLNASAESATAQLGLKDVAPNQPVGTLGVGQCQMVEIAAALHRKCNVLILDEPTAALTTPEIDRLFVQIRQLKAAGVGIIYVSHRMEEIRAISDRLTILRDGQWIATKNTADLNHDQIVRLMVGRDLPPAAERSASSANQALQVALRVRGLCRGAKVQNVSFDAHRGEILGFAGLMGSGRTETMRAIFGADRAQSGEIYLHGSDVPARIRSPRDAVRQGIALLTEDRKGQGLLLPMRISENITLPRLGQVARWRSWISKRRESDTAQGYVKSLSIRCRSANQRAVELSGGNQQKIVIAKWLFRDCDILIFDEPTRGIDIGAKFEIYQLLSELAGQGKAIIVVSSDLLELLHIADRIAVMSAGQLVKIFPRGEATQENLLDAALIGHMSAKVAIG